MTKGQANQPSDGPEEPEQNFLRWLTSEAISREPATRFVLVLAPIALIVAPLAGLFADFRTAMAWIGSALLMSFLVPVLVYLSRNSRALKFPALTLVWIGVIYVGVLAFTSVADAASKTDWSFLTGAPETVNLPPEPQVTPPDMASVPTPTGAGPEQPTADVAFEHCLAGVEEKANGNPDIAFTLTQGCLR